MTVGGVSRVGCDANGSIISLDLHGIDLTGAIPDSIGCLASLKHLDLRNNDLSGAVPLSLLIPSYSYLDLSGNSGLVSLPSTAKPDFTGLGTVAPPPEHCAVSYACVPQNGTAFPVTGCQATRLLVDAHICAEG
ncbi:hypothetical protein HK101_004348, partial [Irineochytrium annulatum]